VTIYVFAFSPVAVDVVCPEGLHKYVYGVRPPMGVTLAVPSEPPEQLTFLVESIDAEIESGGAVNEILAGEAQPFESVTVAV
jgi:hypothetical protein